MKITYLYTVSLYPLGFVPNWRNQYKYILFKCLLHIPFEFQEPGTELKNFFGTIFKTLSIENKSLRQQKFQTKMLAVLQFKINGKSVKHSRLKWIGL